MAAGSNGYNLFTKRNRNDMRYLLVLITAMLVLSGCGGTYVPLYDTVINEAGKNVKELAGYTKDASVLKEREVHKTLRNRDTEYGKAYKESGYKIKFKTVELAPGLIAYLPEEIAFRSDPKFNQQLPTEPSEHPVWKTTDSAINTIAKYGLIGFGISELSGVINKGFENSGDRFGDGSIFNQSFNGGNGVGPTTTSTSTAATP